MDNQRWWAAIIRAITSGLGLFALFALLLALFAGVVVFSNASEPAKLWILAVIGVFWVGIPCCRFCSSTAVPVISRTK